MKAEQFGPETDAVTAFNKWSRNNPTYEVKEVFTKIEFMPMPNKVTGDMGLMTVNVIIIFYEEN